MHMLQFALHMELEGFSLAPPISLLNHYSQEWYSVLRVIDIDILLTVDVFWILRNEGSSRSDYSCYVQNRE